MRIPCLRPVMVRKRIIGGFLPLICLPLSAADVSALIDQAQATAAYVPDMVEWRADRFEGLEAPGALADALEALRTALGDLPLVFTCRGFEEGGVRAIAADLRLKINLAAIASGHIDILDTEISNGEDFIAAVRGACRHAGVKLILSYHNFQQTPDADVILDRLARAEALGADVAKAAVMPRSGKDVLTLLGATEQARGGAVKIPLITMAMGAEGSISRIVGARFGSDVSFAVGMESTAPGQIPIVDLREAWRVLKIR